MQRILKYKYEYLYLSRRYYILKIEDSIYNLCIYRVLVGLDFFFFACFIWEILL